MSIEEIEELHYKAMEKAELAIIAEHNKNYNEALRLNKEAFILERNAALLAIQEQVGEPSESVLLRSVLCLGQKAKISISGFELMTNKDYYEKEETNI